MKIPGLKELILVRHARHLAANSYHIDGDTDLTAFGKEQAEMLGRFFVESFPGCELYTSPFLRCLRTAKAIKESLDSHCFVLPELGEWGAAESHKATSVPSRGASFERFAWPQSKGPWIFAAESNEAFLQRMYAAYDALPNRAIVVTHGTPIQILSEISRGNYVNAVPAWDHSVGHGSISWIRNGRRLWYGRQLYWEGRQ